MKKVFCPLQVKEAKSGWYTEQERSAADEGEEKDSVVSRTVENTKKSTNLIQEMKEKLGKAGSNEHY